MTRIVIAAAIAACLARVALAEDARSGPQTHADFEAALAAMFAVDPGGFGGCLVDQLVSIEADAARGPGEASAVLAAGVIGEMAMYQREAEEIRRAAMLEGRDIFSEALPAALDLELRAAILSEVVMMRTLDGAEPIRNWRDLHPEHYYDIATGAPLAPDEARLAQLYEELIAARPAAIDAARDWVLAFGEEMLVLPFEEVRDRLCSSVVLTATR